MGTNNVNEILESFSPLWWKCILTIVLSIVVLVRIPLHWKSLKRRNYDIFLALILLINILVENLYNYKTGQWTLQQNLPAHLCSITNILCIILLFNYKQWIAEVIFYWGLAGGIYALLTPQFITGTNGYNFFSYFIGHGGLLLVISYIIIHHKFRPRPKSWLWALGYSEIVAIIVWMVDYAVNANYMFLTKKPVVKNPFLIGEWPYYIIVVQLVALIHFWIFYLPFAKSNKRKLQLA
jgi:hypothetical integral membrane protein (TIGR02206 family)